MKRGRIYPQVLLSIALVFNLILPASVMAQGQITPMVAAGCYNTVGLKSDGTVVAAGWDNYGQFDVGGWRDIVQIAAGYGHTVGLKSNSTVVAVGDNSDGQCDVGNWTDITQVAAGGGYTVGLKADGTAVAVGYNEYNLGNVSNWTDIAQVAAGHILHMVGLKSDGTVVVAGADGDTIAAILYVPGANITAEWLDVGNWTDIIQVSAGDQHTVGLESDGTVIAVGNNGAEQCNVGNWTDIVQVAAGIYHTVGLKADGTVVAAGFEFALPTRWNLTKTSNWPLIGGIIAAVAAAGLVIFFVRRKRATQTKGG